MRNLGLFVAAGLFAVLVFWIGYRVGTETWYSTGYHIGYTTGTHDVCAKLATEEQHVIQAINAAPHVDPAKAQLLITAVAVMRSDTCSQ